MLGFLLSNLLLLFFFLLHSHSFLFTLSCSTQFPYHPRRLCTGAKKADYYRSVPECAGELYQSSRFAVIDRERFRNGCTVIMDSSIYALTAVHLSPGDCFDKIVTGECKPVTQQSLNWQLAS